jgi:multidrug resistance efflux pump
VELAVQRENEVAEYERTIGQLRQQLLAAIAQWKEQYAVIAPMDGIVSLQGYWSKGQHVTVGSALASIVPEKETEVIGRMEVPSAGFGKVETGQTVNVKLNGFPYMEYGVLKGTIRSISSVPASVQTATGTTIAYTVEVVFPEGMRTTYEKELPMIQQMDDTGEIITEDMRLIEQFIQPIVSLFKNR